MKQRIEAKLLNELTKSQKENLRKLWLPGRYDIALAHVCVDVENDIYIDIEFCVGSVKAWLSGNVTLYDLRAIDGYVKLVEEGGNEEIDEPTAYNKNDCLPLLSIGQMINIMQQLSFSRYHFYLLAGTGTVGCEVGNYNSILKNKILKEGYVEESLCDVLWKMVKSFL